MRIFWATKSPDSRHLRFLSRRVAVDWDRHQGQRCQGAELAASKWTPVSISRGAQVRLIIAQTGSTQWPFSAQLLVCRQRSAIPLHNPVSDHVVYRSLCAFARIDEPGIMCFEHLGRLEKCSARLVRSKCGVPGRKF
jgi:hypothetical protein